MVLSYPVSKLQKADDRISFEPVCNVRVGPASPLLKSLGQVPVVEGDQRFDSVGDQLVDNGVVVVHSSLAHFSSSLIQLQKMFFWKYCKLCKFVKNILRNLFRGNHRFLKGITKEQNYNRN